MEIKKGVIIMSGEIPQDSLNLSTGQRMTEKKVLPFPHTGIPNDHLEIIRSLSGKPFKMPKKINGVSPFYVGMPHNSTKKSTNDASSDVKTPIETDKKIKPAKTAPKHISPKDIYQNIRKFIYNSIHWRDHIRL